MILKLLGGVAVFIGVVGLIGGVTGSPDEEGYYAGILISAVLLFFGVGIFLKRDSEQVPADETADVEVPVRGEDAEARFVIIGGEEDGALIERLEDFVNADSRVSGAAVEEGSWYSNGENGPPWVRLVVGCARNDRDDLMESVRDHLASQGAFLKVNYF